MRTKTIRSLLNEFPVIGTYYYTWRNTEEPELEQDLEEVLSRYNYELVEEDEEYIGEYNDIKGYLNCKIKKIR